MPVPKAAFLDFVYIDLNSEQVFIKRTVIILVFTFQFLTLD